MSVAHYSRTQLQQALKGLGLVATGSTDALRLRLQAAQLSGSSSSSSSSPSSSSVAAAEDESRKRKLSDDDDDLTTSSDSALPPSKRAKATNTEASLDGKTFLIMGKMERGLQAIEQLVRDAGGRLVTSVSKTLDYVVCGPPERTPYGGVSGLGSKKYSEAKRLKRHFIDEAELVRMVDTRHNEQGEDPAVRMWQECLQLLGLPTTPAPAASSDEEDQAILPRQLLSLLALTDGVEIPIHPVTFWASREYMEAQLAYSKAYAAVWNSLRWAPLGCDPEYTMLRVLDTKSGMCILTFEHLNGATVMTPGLAQSIEVYRDLLLEHSKKLAPGEQLRISEDDYSDAMRLKYPDTFEQPLKTVDPALFNRLEKAAEAAGPLCTFEYLCPSFSPTH